MKYTQTTQDKIETVIEEAGYIVRYERGSFQSGFCILEDRKVVVLNKFLQLEGRINTLIDLIPQLKIDVDALTPESKKNCLLISWAVIMKPTIQPTRTNDSI